MRLMAAVVGVLLGVAVSSEMPAAAEDVTLNGKFGEVTSSTKIGPGNPSNVELEQKVRVDQLTSSDPDWDGATITLYEQSISFPTSGSYSVYGVIDTKSGDQAFIQYDGDWEVATKDGEFVEAPFEADGVVLGGTGRLQQLSGAVVQAGKVTPTEGIYSINITTFD